MRECDLTLFSVFFFMFAIFARFIALSDVRFEFLVNKYPQGQNLTSWGAFLLIVRLRRFFPRSAIFPAFGGHAPFFVFVPVRSSESGLGSCSKSSAMKFCIEWSNRELLRPSRRRDMAIFLFRHEPSCLQIDSQIDLI